MILEEEFESFKSLFEDIKDVELTSFLSDEEIKVIDQSGKANVVLFNLKNRLLGKPRSKRTTICLQRLHDGYNFDEWLKKVAKKIWFDDDTYIDIGISFLATKPTTNEMIYIWAAKALASFQLRCSSFEQCLDKFNKIGKMSEADILTTTFFESPEGEHFKKSGFIPTKIVCSYLWVNK